MWEKRDPPFQKIIRNHLQNCPHFRGLPPLAGRHKGMTEVYLLMQKVNNCVHCK